MFCPMDLRNSPVSAEALLENSIDIVTLISENGEIIYQSPSITEQLGYSAEEMVGSNIFNLLHEDDQVVALDAFGDLMAGRARERIVVRIKASAGDWRSVQVVGKPFQHADFSGMLLNTREVTAQVDTLTELRRSEELRHAAFNATGTICCISVLDTGEFIDVNDAWIEMCGWTREEAVGSTAVDLNIWGSPENRQRIINALRENESLRQYQVSVQTKDHETRTLLMDAEVVNLAEGQRLFITGIDITERERIEMQLRQSQRMEAVGQLTGGVAHDLNNMLTVILGQIDLTTGKDLSPDAYQDALGTIRRATERGSELIQQLMIFSRRQNLKPQVVNVANTLRGMVTLLEGSLGGEINIDIRTNGVFWECFVDEGLLENAILNLSINARDAMPSGGNLIIDVSHHAVLEADARRFEINPGDYIRIDVIDDGVGMEEDAVISAFEPFFTTKPVGQGTGLGLSMVFGFVKQSGGHIEISSSPGAGTTVCLFLPRTTQTNQTQHSTEKEAEQLLGKSVLLIEDNKELRQVVRHLLEALGTIVFESDGTTLDLSEPHIDYVISDVVLPGQEQGPDLVNIVREKYPGIHVIFMSGYPREKLPSGEENSYFLKKPFSLDELRYMMSSALQDH